MQEHTSRYLQQLASGMTLVLSATKPAPKAGADAEIEKITKTVHVRQQPWPCTSVGPASHNLRQAVGALTEPPAIDRVSEA